MVCQRNLQTALSRSPLRRYMTIRIAVGCATVKGRCGQLLAQDTKSTPAPFWDTQSTQLNRELHWGCRCTRQPSSPQSQRVRQQSRRTARRCGICCGRPPCSRRACCWTQVGHRQTNHRPLAVVASNVGPRFACSAVSLSRDLAEDNCDLLGLQASRCAGRCRRRETSL